MSDFFEDFLSWGFGRPANIRFNTARTQDMNPVYWEAIVNDQEEKIGYKSICRTVGIASEDVKVELEKNYISVKGETEFDGHKCSTYFEIPISDSVIGDIENIKYKTQNGLTYIYLYVKKPDFKKINIEKI